jgi:uncharacterized protein YcfJ
MALINDDEMAYVAADPAQPGAAWAAFVDKPQYKADLAKVIASWVRKGAQVQRVPVQQARDMMSKWVRPEKKKKCQRGGAVGAAVTCDLVVGEASRPPL